MLNVDLKMTFVLLSFVLAVWKVKKGFHNGMMKEIVNILSAVISCVCIALVFLTISSVVARTFSTLTVCIAGLTGIGIIYKFCNLIFRPITAIVNVSIINGLDKISGAIIGLCEALIFSWFMYHMLDHFGIYIF